MNGLLTIDDTKPILQLLRKVKLRIDPQYRGECARLAENAGVRLNYFRADGLTIDGACEAIWAGGFTRIRPTPYDLFELLESAFVFSPNATATVRYVRNERIAAEDAERAAEVRRSTRLRLYECSSCFKKIRAADDHLEADHFTTDETGERQLCGSFILKTVVLNPLPF